MRAINIKWDVDNDEDGDIELPTEIEIPKEIKDEEEVSDYITNATGFCHKGFVLTDQ